MGVKGKQQAIDRGIFVIKAIAIVGVVLHHISNRRLEPETQLVLQGVAHLFSWCVMAFFAVSGWLHSRAEKRKYLSIHAFAFHRILRLLVPFVLLCVVYSIAFEVIETLGVIDTRAALPDTFGGKILASLWPAYGGQAAEQLYFLPLLFAISLFSHTAFRLAGPVGVLSLGTGALALLTLSIFPKNNVGFSFGVFVAGLFFYCAGFLMEWWKEFRRAISFSVAAVCLVFLLVGGLENWARVVPLLLLLALPWLRLADAPALSAIGEASGTIYIYHVPFILQPMVILVAHLPTVGLQVGGALLAVCMTCGICMAIYFGLRGTRLRALLM